MMRTILAVLMVAVTPVLVAAQTNTTGTLSPNTTVTQALPATPGGTTSGASAATPTPTPTSPTAVVPARDAAIVLCAQDFSTGTGRLVVFTASTSAGTPAITAGAACAQALSDLFVAGFSIIDVLPFNQQLQYTLVR
jgi:hypothetical protein